MDKRLIIIATEQNSGENPPSISRKQLKRLEIQGKFEALWQEDPLQFDPNRNCIEKERLERTFQLLCRHCKLEGKKVVDLGCGKGDLARRIASAGASVDAVDIAQHPLDDLKREHSPNLHPIQDLVPVTGLPDETYDIVISTDVIGYLSRDDRRLYMAELSRLVKADGFVICSTAIDINTAEAPQAFGALLETEFQPTEWVFSYHAYSIRLKRWLEWISHSLAKKLAQNRGWMIKLENICRTMSPESGISHVIFMGQRRPLEIPSKEELMAILPKGKRQVWE